MQDEVKRKKEQDSRTLYVRFKRTLLLYVLSQAFFKNHNVLSLRFGDKECLPTSGESPFSFLE